MNIIKYLIPVTIMLSFPLNAQSLKYGLLLGSELNNVQVSSDSIPTYNLNPGAPIPAVFLGGHVNKQVAPNIDISFITDLGIMKNDLRLHLGTEAQYFLNPQAYLSLGVGIITEHLSSTHTYEFDTGSDIPQSVTVMDITYHANRLRYSLGLASYITEELSASAQMHFTKSLPLDYELNTYSDIPDVGGGILRINAINEVLKASIRNQGMSLALHYHF